jgi:myosin-1
MEGNKVFLYLFMNLKDDVNIRFCFCGYRFLDRFYLLSQETFPEWFGTDEEGCRAIIKCVKGLIPALKKESEVQYGSNLIFIQSPETYVLLCQLREERINLVPIPIQRCWRRYITFKQVNKLPGMMSELYSGNKKARKYVFFYCNVIY